MFSLSLIVEVIIPSERGENHDLVVQIFLVLVHSEKDDFIIEVFRGT